MAVKAIVFDYGGVICFPPPPEADMDLGRLTGLPVETFRELNCKHRREWDRGSYDAVEFYRLIVAGCGAHFKDEELARIAQADMDNWKNVDPATVRLMRDVKAAGFTLGILSNISHDFLAWASKNVPVFGEADVAVFSCKHNIIKPEAGIYEILRKQLGCEFGEIVFFDDLSDNIDKARELGIQGFLWEGAENGRERIMSL
ncbi:MAG: HAD family phosphatase [Treponema sp.]|nr:HAD family phosphatase [Treponema sp.]